MIGNSILLLDQVLRNGAGSTSQCNTIWYQSLLYKVVFMTQRRRVKLSAMREFPEEMASEDNFRFADITYSIRLNHLKILVFIGDSQGIPWVFQFQLKGLKDEIPITDGSWLIYEVDFARLTSFGKHFSIGYFVNLASC
jgi:hypothetical protein